MPSKRKFLVLGIGNAQVDLLQQLRKLPHTTIYALSNTEEGRGRSLVDKFEKIDITKKEEVLQYASSHNIDFIYSIGSDVAMPTVAWVAEQLNIKTFISSQVANICSNKHLFREKLKNIYGAVPYKVLDRSLNIQNITFPAIVKPVDSQGQRGISEITSTQQLLDAYKKAIYYSRKKEALIEEKIEGSEVSVHTYLKDGEILFFLPSDRISWDSFEGGIIHKHLLPATVSRDGIKNLYHLVSEVIETLEIKNGPVYFQIKMRRDHPYLIEVTPRLDGCHMWRQIYKSTGVNLLEITIRHLMDLPFEIPKRLAVRPSTLEFLCQVPNQPFQKQPIAKNACFHEFYYREGDIVQPMNEQYEKCGYQIIMDEKDV